MCYWSFWKILTFPWSNSRGKSNPIQYLHTTFYQQLLWYEEVPFLVHYDTFFRLIAHSKNTSYSNKLQQAAYLFKLYSHIKGLWRDLYHVSIYWLGFTPLWNSYRIGHLFPFKTNNLAQFLYRIAFTTQHFWKWYKFYRVGFTMSWKHAEV